MKKVQNITAIGMAFLVATCLATPVFAADNKHVPRGEIDHQERQNNNFYAYAKVTHVKALFKQVKVSRPRRECRDEHSARPIDRYAGGEHNANVIVGGIIGGAIGNQVGGGHAKEAATIAGTLIGAAVGHAKDRRRHRSEKVEVEHRQRCDDHVEARFEKRPDGYGVSYRYLNKTFQTRMKHRPGKRVRIKVQISLAD